MSFYNDMQAVAANILKDFKQGVIKYVDITPGTGPDDEPGDPTETFFTLDAAARGVKFKYVQNGLAVAGDLQVTASVPATNEAGAVVSLTPNMNGFIEVDDERYKIVQILPKPSAGTTVAFVFIVRN